jgi:signal transduction histidine kinase
VGLIHDVRRRLRSVDPRLADGLLTLVLAVGATVQFHHDQQGGLLRWLAIMGTVLPLAWRRQYPLTCYCVQFGCALVSMQAPTYAGYAALFLAMYSLGIHSRHRLRSLAAPIASAVVLAVASELSGPPTWYLQVPAALAEMTIGVGLWLVGHTIRGLEERAGRLEREQELATRVAVADERARLARELHDVVAHSVSVMVVQAGAARRLLGRQPDRAGEALLSVESNGREALAELRRMLGVLTEEDGTGPALAPQPGLGQLDALVERVGAAGLPVEVRIQGAPRPLSPGVDLTAYRIIQEALTNSLKYAKGARTEVVVEFGDGELKLEVLNAGGVVLLPAGAGAGRGLLGMRERVSVYGGQLEAGGRPEGGFAVRASLPLQPA